MTSDRDVVVVAGVRTPFVRAWSVLADVSAVELGRVVVRDVVERAEIDPAEIDEVIAAWMADHTQAEVLEICDRHETTVAPVYDIAQIFEDEHFAAREAIVTVDDAELGPTKTADVFPRLTRTPGKVRHLGPRSGTDTDAILAELGYGEDEITRLREQKVV